MARRFRNCSGIDQIFYLAKHYRSWPTRVRPGGIVIAYDAYQWAILKQFVKLGVLVEVDDSPAPDALHATAVEWHGTPLEPAPIFKNVARREFVIHNQEGEIIETILPGATVVGDQYLQFQRPAGPLSLENRSPTPVNVVWKSRGG